MLPKESLPSHHPVKPRVVGGLRAIAHFTFHTLGLRFLLALVSAFALWWYVVPGSTPNDTSSLATGSYRTVPVVAQVHGNPADGYAVTGVLVAPPTITIQGTTPGLGDVSYINTETIDITGATATQTLVKALVLPPGVSSTILSTVTVSIYIAPLPGKVTATVPVALKNLAPNLVGTLSPSAVTVTLKGPLPKLNNLEIHPVVDVSGQGPGSYVLAVQVSAPPDISVEITPADVTVTLTPGTG